MDLDSRVRSLSALQASDRQALAELLVDCVEGGASVSFMQPLSMHKALAFWQGVAKGLARAERALLVADDENGQIVGSVQLILGQAENQLHRADLAKMLVHRRARRQVRISAHPGHPFQTIADSVSGEAGHCFKLIADSVSA